MGRRRRITAIAALAVSALLGGPLLSGSAGSHASAAGAVGGIDNSVHLNQIQVVGSHNSYHQLLTDKEQTLRHSFIGDGDQSLLYQDAPLPVQFQSQKVRQIELDVFLDSAGGRYATPLIRTATGEGPYDPVMSKPGIKVLHVQDVDYHSSCLTLAACLTEIRTWSHAHPSHVPLAILLELKDDRVPFNGFPFVIPEPWTAPGMDALDQEIRSVMSPSDLITPDDVRGSHSTVQQAVTTDGWPTLGESRGKQMFLMDNGGAKRTSYLAGHAGLKGRVLFTNANPGDADAAFVEHNESTDVATIQGLVKQGYVVRTRADADTRDARANDTTHRDAAFRSGAQWVSTDYPQPGLAVGFTSPYFAEIPGGTVARCNPVNAPPSCDSAVLDTIYTPLSPATTTTITTTTVAPTTTTTTSTAPVLPTEAVEPADAANAVTGRSRFTG